jgi:hypothetical protein
MEKAWQFGEVIAHVFAVVAKALWCPDARPLKFCTDARGKAKNVTNLIYFIDSVMVSSLLKLSIFDVFVEG